MNRTDLLSRNGCLAIIRQPAKPVPPAAGQPGTMSTYVSDAAEVFVAILDDGRILAFNGHVDLGTGIRTSLAQIVAEELEVPAARVEMQLGDTAATPNQGPTIASATIQISAVPLRCAAAQARAKLLELASSALGEPVTRLATDNAQVFVEADPDGPRITFAELVAGRRISLALDASAPVKDPASYRVVGKSTPRIDLPAKATGELTFVHDMRVPGMLHGRVVRPPYSGVDAGPFVSMLLERVEPESVSHIPGLREVVVIGDFVGVVAEREEQAIRAARELRIVWKPLPPLRSMDDPGATIAAAPAKRRLLLEEGDVEAARAIPGSRTLSRTYVWPYQMHGSIGPSCALVDYRVRGAGRITVWSGTQNPVSLRYDLATLAGRDEADFDIVRMEASGCYGRNCADDVCGDALLLSRAVGRPVRVQLSRTDEHLWEPKGSGQVVTVTGTLDAGGRILGYDFATRYPSNDAPLLASLLTGVRPADKGGVFEMGDRTAVSPYASPNRRFVCDDLAPLVRASWLRGVSALPNSFAHDSFADELAALAGIDPLEFRLNHLQDDRAVELLMAVAAHAGWTPRPQRPTGDERNADARIVRGRGLSYARYVHSRFPGFGAAWSAWVVNISVDRVSGEIRVEHVTVGQDTGMMVNPDGVRHQIHGNVVQVLSRALKERVRFADGKVASREWSSYPILTFPELPAIDVVLMPRQGEPPLGAGESASVPGPAALANALFDATGVRFTAPPFIPETIRAGLREAGKLLSGTADTKS